MSNPKISVIVPIYNVEKYLDACLSSIQKQTFKDFEVLLINDGTPDNSMEIAQKYADADKRFTIFNKTNGGLSDARNFGLKKAKGEYIAFIDSDDRIRPKFLENLYRAITRFDADVAVCNFCLYYVNKNKIKRSGSFLQHNRLYDPISGMKELLNDRNMRFYVWNKLWRASLFTDNNIEMTKMFYEDIVICSQLFCHAKRIVTINYCGYIYTRAFSKYIEVSMSKTRINDYINTIPLVREYLSERNIYKKVKKPFNRHILHVFFSVPLLCMQANKSLDKNVFVNSISGMKRVVKCCKLPVDQLKKLIRTDSVN